MKKYEAFDATLMNAGIQYSYPPTTFASCEGLMVREPQDPFFF